MGLAIGDGGTFSCPSHTGSLSFAIRELQWASDFGLKWTWVQILPLVILEILDKSFFFFLFFSGPHL